MSKIQTLGYGPKFANLNLNIQNSGYIGDAATYHDLTEITQQASAWYQTIFRRELFGLYTQQPSIENLCVNIILEQGYASYIYKNAAKYFTAALGRITANNNNQVPPDVPKSLIKLVAFSMDTVLSELKTVGQNPNMQTWLNQLKALFNNNLGNFYLNCKRALDNSYNGGGGGQPQQSGYAMPGQAPTQNNSYAMPGQNHAPQQQHNPYQQPQQNGYTPYNHPPSNQPKQPNVSGIVMDYLDDEPDNVPQTPTPTASKPSSDVVDGIFIMGGDDASNEFILSSRRSAPGSWATDKVTGDDADAQDMSGYTLVGDGIKLSLDELRVKQGQSLVNLEGWQSKIKDTLEDCSYDADIYHARDMSNDLALFKAAKLRKYTEALVNQFSLYPNDYGYVCGVTDSVWGSQSLFDVYAEQFGSNSLSAIDDDDLQYVNIANRIYPIIKSNSEAALRWVKRVRGESHLPTFQSDYHWYIIVPLWNDTLNEQYVEIYSLIKKENIVDLEKYKEQEVKVPAQPTAKGETPAKPVKRKREIVELEGVVSSSNHMTIMDVARFKSNNSVDNIIVNAVSPTYFIIDNKEDEKFFSELREEVGVNINDISALAEVVLEAEEEGKVSSGFVSRLSQTIGVYLFQFIVNDLGITTLSLDKDIIHEIADVKAIIEEHFGNEEKIRYVAAEHLLLNMLFGELDDDYLAALVPHLKGATGFQVSTNHGKYRVTLPNGNESGKYTAVFGTGVIPMVRESTIIVLGINDHELNPDGLLETSGHRMGEATLQWIHKIWPETTSTITALTVDGVAYSVELDDASDELDAPAIRRI